MGTRKMPCLGVRVSCTGLDRRVVGYVVLGFCIEDCFGGVIKVQKIDFFW